MDERSRRIGGWGFEGERFPPSGQLVAWLREHVGPPGPSLPGGGVQPPDLAPRRLPELPGDPSSDPLDRLAHARGQGLADIVRVRSGTVAALPDAICRPRTATEVEGILDACRRHGVTVIPWGGGTSVTGGVTVIPSDRPVVSLDLGRMAGLTGLDEGSRLAVLGPGTPGPAVEAALAPHGLTLGHFPQSFELATVGGWIATRSSGQESLGFGRIEDMVAGLELVAPDGRLDLPALPASAAGPDLRQMVLGSEGRLGVITSATLRVRPRPERRVVEAALVPDLEAGLEAVRELVWCGLPLAMVRLSDAAETEVALAVGLASSRLAPVAKGWLRLKGIGRGACLLLVGAAGHREGIDGALGCARSTIRRRRGVVLGRRPGRHWTRDRFRHPYLREELLELGWATDTLETAVPWTAAAATRECVRGAIAGALESDGERVAVLCHVSHPYRDGTSLYFTFFLRTAGDPDELVARWARVKRAATDALVATGATLSHHHGIGQWHAPWYPREAGDDGRRLVAAAARELDPDGVLNPHVLLDDADRLEA